MEPRQGMMCAWDLLQSSKTSEKTQTAISSGYWMNLCKKALDRIRSFAFADLLGLILGWGGAIGFSVCIAHLAFLPLANGDMYWQVRAGELMLRQHRFLDRDIFSYTVAGVPWNNHEWLFEVLLALLHRALGWLGLRLLVLSMIGGTITAVMVHVGRRSGLPVALGLACTWLGLVWYKFIPAPQTLSMVLFMLGYWLFLRPGLFVTWRRFALLAFLLLWGNISAEVAIFLPFLLVDQCFRLARGENPDLPAHRRCLWLGLALVVPTLNPSGASIIEYVIDGTLVNRAVNPEFRHLWETAGSVHAWVKGLAWLAILTWIAWTIRNLARESVRLVGLHRAAAPGLAILFALLFERNLWLLLLPMSQMALGMGPWLNGTARRPGTRFLPLLAAAGFFLAFMLTLPWWSPGVAFRDLTRTSFYTIHLSADDLPITCDHAVEGISPNRRVFTSRPWGNWMIWRFPDRPVFIDGRNREYPVILHQLSDLVAKGREGAQAVLDAFDVDVVLVEPGWLKKPGIARERWERIFATRICAVYMRKSPVESVPSPE